MSIYIKLRINVVTQCLSISPIFVTLLLQLKGLNMNFTHAIVRRPGKSIVAGLSLSNRTPPDYEKALVQHRIYIETLTTCGVKVKELDALEEHPDSTFVEDVAVLTPHCAIITNPGAASRKAEVSAIQQTLTNTFSSVETIDSPGTLDGGDVLQIGKHFFIGQSKRTNSSASQQLITILENHGMSGSTVEVNDFLHLKTGVTAINDTTLIAAGEFIEHPAFQNFEVIPVSHNEIGAANCIACNGHIIMPEGFPETREKLVPFVQKIIEVNISEFAKIDGGLTRLSLRF